MFPYRKYNRYPLVRRRYHWRMNHDVWCWLLVLDVHTVAQVAVVVAASSLGIIVRSLVNEHKEDVQ